MADDVNQKVDERVNDIEYVIRCLVIIGWGNLAATVRDVLNEREHWQEQAAVYLRACERYQEEIERLKGVSA